MPSLNREDEERLDAMPRTKCGRCEKTTTMSYCGRCDLHYSYGHTEDCPTMKGSYNNDHSKCRRSSSYHF